MKTYQLYHVYNRGNNREDIFKETKNYDFFLQLYQKYLTGLAQLHAYCLMPNHFHLLIGVLDSAVKTPDPYNDGGKLNPITKGFKNFFIAYVKAINKKYGRTGSLFQAKFKKKLIENEYQYLFTTAYIHNNPVKAGLSQRYDDWQYSSYLGLIGRQDELKLARKEVFDTFGGQEQFLSFHEAYEQRMSAY
ncbi:MAG: transposase [Saprospiraceae bacterium]|nr:transposase [Saprospiraceae bacterium]